MRSEKIRRDGDKGGVYLNKLTFSASQCKALGIRDHTETHSHTHSQCTTNTWYTHMHYGSVPFPERWIIVPLHSEKQRTERGVGLQVQVDRQEGRQSSKQIDR